MIFALMAIWLFVCLFWYLLQRRHVLIYGRKIPSPRGIPILGNILIFQGPPEGVFKKIFDLTFKFPKIMAVWLGPALNVVVYDSKYIEMIFKSSKKIDKADEYKYVEPWLGTSLIISTGDIYRAHKKLIAPTFYATNLKQYVGTFNECSSRLVNDVKKHDGKEEFNINSFLSFHMLASGLETLMGKKEIIENDFRKYENAIKKLEKYVYMRLFLAWLRPFATFYFSKLRKLQNDHLQLLNRKARIIMEERKNFLRAHNSKFVKFKTRNVLDALLENGVNSRGITENEVIDEIKGFSFAAQETTSTALGFTLCLLGIHEEVQDKVVNELENIFGKSLRPVTYEDIFKMRYLEQVIHEAMRLYPPIPLIALEVQKNINLDKYVVPCGSTLVIHMMRLHRDPKQFRNPNKFDPENFGPEKVKQRSPCCFIPFSLGMRRCLGQKYAIILMKVVLSTFLRHYTVHSVRKEEDFELAALTTLKLKNGCLINIQSRNREFLPCDNEMLTDH